MSAPLLEVKDLHVYRGEAHVLQGVDLAVRPNRVTALLGRNGAGKTTTLLAVLGLLPGRGTVRFDGEDLLAERTPARVRRGIGYVPEDREVFTALTVEENLRLAARTPEAADRLDMVHELFPDLAARRKQRAGSLSGGQQQMVAIARALLNPNRLLLVDEPTKGLAPVVVRDVVAALEKVAEQTTVLLVEQNLRVAERLATDVVVLDHGTVVHRGDMAELFADTDRASALLGVSAATGPARGPSAGGRS
ncbi:ABC transporter ATP-binding protein [Blastococcus goldschmidtiae]|uniref:ABC transporter ATP-binding protein n=1 Tax=Blastococcus goldschmidtiae TaxID=3075546 RepID=A0ABU2K7Q0_9ACTN|nr:ABC transporter ATP-binding protein [Blastococcus sp. DSM 46792]MDT0276202.1 ABC transporter ATP-binding protein [Blastococcus sp. DSM 46792]